MKSITLFTGRLFYLRTRTVPITFFGIGIFCLSPQLIPRHVCYFWNNGKYFKLPTVVQLYRNVKRSPVARTEDFLTCLYKDPMTTVAFWVTNPCRITRKVGQTKMYVCTLEEFILVDIWIHCCASWN